MPFGCVILPPLNLKSGGVDGAGILDTCNLRAFGFNRKLTLSNPTSAALPLVTALYVGAVAGMDRVPKLSAKQ